MRAILSCLLVLTAVALAFPTPSGAETGTVWLTGTIDGPGEKGRFRIPLEWLATVDDRQSDTIRVEDVTVNTVELWKTYRDLPVGEVRPVEKGISKDGSAYDIQVVSDTPSRTKAAGKVRILNRDKNGKVTDIGFPLGIPGLVQEIANSLFRIEGGESRITAKDLDLNNPADLRRLADYGPFTFFEGSQSDSSRVRVWIE